MLSAEEMSDRLELQDLLIRYSEAIDRREFDELDAIFVPDAYIDYRDTGGIDGQYPQIKEWLAETLPTYFERNAHMRPCGAMTISGGSEGLGGVPYPRASQLVTASTTATTAISLDGRRRIRLLQELLKRGNGRSYHRPPVLVA